MTTSASTTGAIVDRDEGRAGPGRQHRERLIVLYDRDCGLCTATARRLRRWDRDGRLRLVPLQDAASAGPDVAGLVAGRSLSSALHVVDPASGRVSSGGAGVLEIVSRLPGGRAASAVNAVPPSRWLVGFAYDAVARHRHQIGRWLRLEGPACDVPR